MVVKSGVVVVLSAGCVSLGGGGCGGWWKGVAVLMQMMEEVEVDVLKEL